MEDKKKEILNGTVQIFLRCGIKSVTMDDIAKQLHISKKTLYKYVQDKNDLVYQAVESEREVDECEISSLMDSNMNAIDQMFEVSKKVHSTFSEIHPSLFYDLEKFYPKAWKKTLDFRFDFIYNRVSDNLRRGIKQGVYREDLKIDIMAKLWVLRVNDIINSDIFKNHEYKPQDIYLEMFRHYIRGIASDKGREYLTEKLKKEKYIK